MQERNFEMETKIQKAKGGNGKDYLIRLHYHTGLPIVYLNTFNEEVLSKEDYISAEISVYGGLDFIDLGDTSIQIRGRGNSTWWGGGTQKKPYQRSMSWNGRSFI